MKVKLSVIFDILPTTEDKFVKKISSRQAKKFIAILWNTLKDTGKWETKLNEGKRGIYLAYALESETIQIIRRTK